MAFNTPQSLALLTRTHLSPLTHSVLTLNNLHITHTGPLAGPEQPKHPCLPFLPRTTPFHQASSRLPLAPLRNLLQGHPLSEAISDLLSFFLFADRRDCHSLAERQMPMALPPASSGHFLLPFSPSKLQPPCFLTWFLTREIINPD